MMTTPASVCTAASDCSQDGRWGLMDDEGQTQGTVTDTHPHHCEQLLAWGISGANGHKNTADNREGPAQHPPPSTVGICSEGGVGANGHVTTNGDSHTEQEQEPQQCKDHTTMTKGWQQG
jgi:hypothetical protein